MQDNNKFLIFADTRTGSSCLHSLISLAYLRQYNYKSVSEPFHPKVISYFYGASTYQALYKKEPDFEPEPKKWTDAGRILNEDSETIKYIYNKVYEMFGGMKHIWGHLYRQDNLFLLDESINRGYKVVFLYRRNAFLKCLSHMISEQTEVWRIQEIKNSKEIGEINTERLDSLTQRYIKEKQEYENYLKGKPHYFIAYEDFLQQDNLNDGIKGIYECLDFCGIKKSKLLERNITKIVDKKYKMNPKERLRLIKNFNEVQQLGQKKYNQKI